MYPYTGTLILYLGLFVGLLACPYAQYKQTNNNKQIIQNNTEGFREERNFSEITLTKYTRMNTLFNSLSYIFLRHIHNCIVMWLSL